MTVDSKTFIGDNDSGMTQPSALETMCNCIASTITITIDHSIWLETDMTYTLLWYKV